MTVLTFGVLTDIIGKKQLEVAAVASTTELIQQLETDYPALKSIRYAIAVDKKTTASPVALSGSETIALLPPFSGG